MNNHHQSCFLCLLLLSMLLIISSNASFAEDDIRCLQEVRSSLNDPQSKLRSWTFTNTSMGFICRFPGVSCLSDRVIGLDFRDFGISGNIPKSLQFCHNLQSLQLADNSLSGSIPPHICDWLPYLTTLDLSSNVLTGQIPEGLANCSYLNTLVLDGNKLSGTVPYQITSLRWLRRFSVANNELTGTVTPFNHPVDVNYTGNVLCNGFTEHMRWFFWWSVQVRWEDFGSCNNSGYPYKSSGWHSQKNLNELVRDYPSTWLRPIKSKKKLPKRDKKLSRDF